MNENGAIALFDSEFWKDLSIEDRAKFQLFEDRLCMPFSVFHDAIEKTLGRSVFTHELGLKNLEKLRKELLGECPEPTLKDIIELIPKEKRILVSF